MTALSPAIQAVLALFEGPLTGVRFADIDADGLTRLASEVEASATEVEQQEAKLAELKRELAQRQEALLALAQQALAYARIYAESDAALTAQLEAIALPRATKARKPSTKPTVTEDSARNLMASQRAGSPPSEGERVSEDSSAAAGEDASSEASDHEEASAEQSAERPSLQPRAGKVRIARVIKKASGSASAER